MGTMTAVGAKHLAAAVALSGGSFTEREIALMNTVRCVAHPSSVHARTNS